MATSRDYKQLGKLQRTAKQYDQPQSLARILSTRFNSSDNVLPANLAKYDPVDYGLFKSFINHRKAAAKDSFNKVERLKDDSKQKREEVFMRNHLSIWSREYSKLDAQMKSIETELEDFVELLQHNSVDYLALVDDRHQSANAAAAAPETTNDVLDTKETTAASTKNSDDDEEKKHRDEEEEYFNKRNPIDELEEFVKNLNEERIKFKVRTIYPINDLIEDLKYLIKQRQQQKQPENMKKIIETINAIKDQQKTIMRNLERDCVACLEEMNEINEYIMQDEAYVTEGIPEEAFELACPNDELKLSVLHEFLVIDFKHKEKLKNLDEHYNYLFFSKEKHSDGNDLLDSSSVKLAPNYDGWSKSDHEIFQHIYEQYHTHNVTLNVNCNFTLRDLMFDRMRRTLMTLPTTTAVAFNNRSDLVKHEEWTNAHKYYNQQRKLILNEWQESRRALLLKAEATFAEAFELIIKERIKLEEKEKQLRICNDLYAKVSKWRLQKMEALEIQQRIDEMINKQNKQRLRTENERKHQEREMNKRAIKDYHRNLEMQKRQLEEEEMRRLKKLKQNLDDQFEKDRQRVEQRNRMFVERRQKLTQVKQIKQTESEEKEKRLQKFYESVKPDVKSDPVRMISYTESELNKRGVLPNKQIVPNRFVDAQSMYKNFSFNDKQLNADARIRVEQRLRQAGLMQSDYARHLIATLKPPTQPRRDLNSNEAWNCFRMDEKF